MMQLLLVGAGGAVGSIARYLVGGWTLRAFGPNWPYGTFTVNIVGGFLMGVLVGWLAYRGGVEQERARILLGVGVLGGFTTFSAFSLDAARMIETRAYGQVVAYAGLSVFLSIGALFAGLTLARRAFA